MQLNQVLEKSRLYADAMFENLKVTRAKHAKANAERPKAPKLSTRKGKGNGKKRVVESDDEDDGESPKKKRHLNSREATSADGDPTADGEVVETFPQPTLVTGAKLKDYQLEGLQWMVSLHQNGISGILGK